ncbi:MAG: murein biosynthesis integral membrane protein MurJ [Nitrospinae bacterium]|nr:murein biosynthesis integral membrane protein MurJ [Nitrospinota bacterium]
MNPEPPRGAGRSAKERMTLAAGSVSAATLISRILGFVRDMVIASLFGAQAAADAFFVAFRIPNLLRRFTAEGALTAAFVPVFSELRERHGLARAFAMANNLVTLMAVLLMALVAAGIVFAPWVVRVIAPGFTTDPAVFELTALLTAVMFPYILLISLAALFMATLNSMGRFFVPAAAPALLNVAIIACAFALKDAFAQPAMALAVGVLIGGALQLAAQWGTLAAMGYRFRPDFSLRHGDTLKVGALMIPAALGMAAAEVNILIGTLLATLLPQGSVSYLYYANRVAEFPLGTYVPCVPPNAIRVRARVRGAYRAGRADLQRAVRARRVRRGGAGRDGDGAGDVRRGGDRVRGGQGAGGRVLRAQGYGHAGAGGLLADHT